MAVQSSSCKIYRNLTGMFSSKSFHSAILVMRCRRTRDSAFGGILPSHQTHIGFGGIGSVVNNFCSCLMSDRKMHHILHGLVDSRHYTAATSPQFPQYVLSDPVLFLVARKREPYQQFARSSNISGSQAAVPVCVSSTIRGRGCRFA